MSGIDEAVQALLRQSDFCTHLGSPFTARLLSVFANSDALRDPLSEMAAPFDEDLGAAAFALRIAGAFHRRALDEPSGALAALYPSVGGHGGTGLSDAELGDVLLQAYWDDPAFFHSYLQSPPQTNEVGRSAALIGGYLELARLYDLPFRVLEIGASAGLNLGFDRFHYQLGKASWGDASSPVRLEPDWRGADLRPLPDLRVSVREGCDVRPIDVRDEDNVCRLESYVWADQGERLARLRGAVRIAKELTITIDQASADEWLAGKLAEPHAGVVTVVVHSIMWQYMPDLVQKTIRETIEATGAQARPDAPLAWLSMEPWDDPMSLPVLRLQTWPGGEVRDLADLHPHGASVVWKG